MPTSFTPDIQGAYALFWPGVQVWIDWGYDLTPGGTTPQVETYAFSDGAVGGSFALPSGVSSFQIDVNGASDFGSVNSDNWFGYIAPSGYTGDTLTITATRASDGHTCSIVLTKGYPAPAIQDIEESGLTAGQGETLGFGFDADSGFAGTGAQTYTLDDGGAGGIFSTTAFTICPDGDGASTDSTAWTGLGPGWPASSTDAALKYLCQFTYSPAASVNSVTFTATPVSGEFATAVSTTMSVAALIAPAPQAGTMASLMGVATPALILAADAFPSSTAVIGRWTDISGGGNDALDSGAGAASYVAGGLNGRPIVHFDGTGTLASNYGGAIGTIIVVARPSATAAAQTLLSGVTPAGNLAWSLDAVASANSTNPNLATFGLTQNPEQTPASGEGAVSAAGVYKNIFNVLAGRVWRDGVLNLWNIELSCNGKLVSFGRLGATHTPSACESIVIGGRPDGTQKLTGDIALVLISPDPWTTQQLSDFHDTVLADFFGGAWTQRFGQVAFLEGTNEGNADTALYVSQGDDCGESFSYSRASHFAATSSNNNHSGTVRDPKVIQHPATGLFLLGCTAADFVQPATGFSVSVSKNGALWWPANNVEMVSWLSAKTGYVAAHCTCYFVDWMLPGAGGIYVLFDYSVDGSTRSFGIVQMLDPMGEYWGTPSDITFSGFPSILGDWVIYDDPTAVGHFVSIAQENNGFGAPMIGYASTLSGPYTYQSSPTYPTFVGSTAAMNDGYCLAKLSPTDFVLRYSSGSINTNVPAYRRSVDAGKTWGPEKYPIGPTAPGGIGNNGGLTIISQPFARAARPAGLPLIAQGLTAGRLAEIAATTGSRSVLLSGGNFYA